MMKYRKPAALLAAVLLGCALLGGCDEAPVAPVESTTAPGELQTTVFEITEMFQNIRVEGGVSDVRLIPAPDNCTVGCTDIPGLQYSAKVEDGTLVIREDGSAGEYTGAEIIICLTRPDFDGLEITTTDGSMDIPMDFVFTDLNLCSDSGNVTLNGCDADVIHITTVSGNVTGTVRTDKTFTVTSRSGAVHVPDTTGGPCNITTVSGDVTLNIGGAA